MTSVHIIGSGIAGLSCAYTLARRGCEVHISTASDGPDESCCSWWAGGMLAPWCEQESAEPLIGTLGTESMAFWKQFAEDHSIGYHQQGTLVISQSRDQALLSQFERNTHGSKRIDRSGIESLEPGLPPQQSGLFFADEAHLTPREATLALWCDLQNKCRSITTGTTIDDGSMLDLSAQFDWQIDCRGMAAASVLADLRGVKGEMLHLYAPEVSLQRPVRLLHPRYPLYIVPRADHEFMLGATMIEANYGKRITVRSAMELLSAAYSIHPAFAEAEIIEMGVDARPAFDDNLPKIRRLGNTIHVNGLFRHGFLVAPAVARRVADLILNNTICNEVIDANYPEWSNDRHAANQA